MRLTYGHTDKSIAICLLLSWGHNDCDGNVISTTVIKVNFQLTVSKTGWDTCLGKAFHTLTAVTSVSVPFWESCARPTRAPPQLPLPVSYIFLYFVVKPFLPLFILKMKSRTLSNSSAFTPKLYLILNRLIVCNILGVLNRYTCTWK